LDYKESYNNFRLAYNLYKTWKYYFTLDQL